MVAVRIIDAEIKSDDDTSIYIRTNYPWSLGTDPGVDVSNFTVSGACINSSFLVDMDRFLYTFNKSISVGDLIIVGSIGDLLFGPAHLAFHGPQHLIAHGP